MNEKEIMHLNGLREDLYQAMQIGSITLSPKHSSDLYNFMNYQDKEINRLKESLGTAIEDIFTLLRVINSNVKELKCSNDELEIINKYSYNPKGVDKE